MKQSLSPQEQYVLELISKGMTDGDIGEVLKKSPRTVEKYRNKLITLLGATNTASLITKAFEDGYLEV